MEKSKLFKAVAPCSLFCHTCFGYKDGAIQYHASNLYELYKGWYEGHQSAYGENPTLGQAKKLDDIKTFNVMLKGLMNPGCEGCRESCGKGIGCIKGCIIPECTKQHGVDYCAYCDEFPCDRNNAIFSAKVMEKWFKGNKFIAGNGIEVYFEKNKIRAHYIEFYLDQTDE